eukprot:3026440-Rhodomonas_salina.2
MLSHASQHALYAMFGDAVFHARCRDGGMRLLGMRYSHGMGGTVLQPFHEMCGTLRCAVLRVVGTQWASTPKPYAPSCRYGTPHRPTRYPPAHTLRTPYAMSGTDLAYCVWRYQEKLFEEEQVLAAYARPTRCPVLRERMRRGRLLSLIHISEPTRPRLI